MTKLHKIFFALFFCHASGYGQTIEANYAFIHSDDDSLTIIKKAANVVPAARQLRWQQLELIAFFHFGMNTFTDREWGTGKEDPSIFNPTSLDARQWVQVAKNAGFKQIIFTAKHHDGFCLWPSKTTSHSVASSPWKKGLGDVVKEVAAACKEFGLGFGIYLSPWDMNAAVYGTDEYNDFFVTQLTELLTNYGRIDEVWFDGANGEGPNGKKQVYDFNRWYAVIRKLQPDATIAIMGPDVRWVGTETGYGRDQEWSVVPIDNLNPSITETNSQQTVTFKPAGDMRSDDLGSRQKIMHAKGLVWYPAETDVSIRPGWFYHAEEDDKVKSPEKLLDIYFNSVGKNSVLLVNIPPDKKGMIHDSDISTLMKWKALRDEMFKNNLAKSATFSSNNGINTNLLADENSTTYFTTKNKYEATVIDIDLKIPQLVNVVLLQEDISKGQRIEQFEVEALVNKKWRKIAAGSTVGYKRLIQFDTVHTKKLRLKIIASRLNPQFSEIGIFYTKKQYK
ncbi:MAG: alpha-L-fucosidase [Chitinophagaceae bacterium]|nr:alpha-L-fucosidase [Chitinophagaceae bacterium]